MTLPSNRELGLVFRTVTCIIVFLSFGCGSPDIDFPNSLHSKNETNKREEPSQGEVDDQTYDAVVIPPKEYYDALMTDTLRLLDKSGSASSPMSESILWVNFDGANVARGFNRGQSFIPCKSTTVIPAPSLSPADKATIIDMVQAFYDAAGAKLRVTPTKPLSGDFTTIHVGGSYGDLGCRGGANVLGVAPFDRGNVNPNDVGFAFTQNSASARLIAETIAHEAGHSFGLEHVIEQSDLMHASAGPNTAGFGVSRVASVGRIQDAPALLQKAFGGASSSNALPSSPVLALPSSGSGFSPSGIAGFPNVSNGLPGLAMLGNIGQLLPGLANGSVVNITQILPQIQALIPTLGAQGAGSAMAVPGLDKILTIVGLASQTGNTSGGSALPINPALAASILGNTGGAPLSIPSLVAGGGFGSLQQAIDALQGVFGGAFPTAPAGNNGNGILGKALSVITGGAKKPQASAIPTPVPTLPDLTQLLGLNTGATDVTAILSGLTGSAALINSNFNGPEQQALLSLIKVAYLQQYQKVAGSLAP